MKSITAIYLLLPLMTYSQDQFNFSPDEPRTITEIGEYERELNSTTQGFSLYKPYNDEDFEDMIPNVKSKALIFNRTTDDFIPELATWYFFNEDSLVTGFFYSWAFYNPDFNPTENKTLLEAQKRRLKEYQAKHAQVQTQLTDLLGESTSNKVIIKSKKRYIERTIWDNDKLRSVLVLDFSPELFNLPGTNFIGGGDSSIRIKTFYK